MDWLRLIELVRKSGLKAKPEVGIQFGAGGATASAELKAEGTRDPRWAIAQAKRFLDAGAEIIMVESEGITENVDPRRTEVPAKFVDEIGMEKLMFEAADPDVFEWYIKNYGADVNLFVDHRSFNWNACVPVSGGQRVCGEGSSRSKTHENKSACHPERSEGPLAGCCVTQDNPCANCFDCEVPRSARNDRLV